jgi:hypothetical protein
MTLETREMSDATNAAATTVVFQYNVNSAILQSCSNAHIL